jgi:tetraacyldisaccharide 4'-kinase
MTDYLYRLATDKQRGFLASLIKALLFMVALLYALVVRILILFYRLKPYRLDCQVISVGNITLGGTGKTVLVEYLARYLKNQGHKVAILSRGYKKNSKFKIQNSKFSYESMGDEPYMLQMKLKDVPVVVDANRIRAAHLAIRDYAVDTVILDDGFQQWRIIKDLEIVAIDASEPFGNRQLIPRGILRQPLSSLRRAEVLVLTKTNLNPDIVEIKDFLTALNPSAIIMEATHEPCGFYRINAPDELLNTAVFKGKTVSAFSGIGDPDSFENLLSSLGMNIGLSFIFPDHYRYSQKDIDRIIHSSKDKGIETIVTTEKDAVRLPRLPIFVLKIELKIIKNEEGLHSRLLRLYRG